MLERSTQQIVGKVADTEPSDFALRHQGVDALIVSSMGVSGSGQCARYRSITSERRRLRLVRIARVMCGAVRLHVRPSILSLPKSGPTLDDKQSPRRGKASFLESASQLFTRKSKTIAFCRVRIGYPGSERCFDHNRACGKSRPEMARNQLLRNCNRATTIDPSPTDEARRSDLPSWRYLHREIVSRRASKSMVVANSKPVLSSQVLKLRRRGVAQR